MFNYVQANIIFSCFNPYFLVKLWIKQNEIGQC